MNRKYWAAIACMLMVALAFAGVQAQPSVAADVYSAPEETVSQDVYAPAGDELPPTPPIGDGITVYVNYKPVTFDVPPVIESGRTLVPLRAIFEALGAQVEWDEATKAVTAKSGEDTVKLTIDKTQAFCNDKEVALDVPAKLVQGRTIVPLRFVSESLGAEVNWNEETQVITINY